MRTLTLALILATASVGAAAQAYRWVDEKGKVHYGDRPPSTANTTVAGTRSAKPRTGEPVTPGMKPEEVVEVFGKPDHVRKVAAAAGESQFWTYRRPKGERSTYVIKFEGGVVTEVATEESTGAPVAAPASTPPAAAPPATATAAGPSAAERQAQADAERRARDCASARNQLRSADDAARRGGSAQTMDRLRDDRRRHEQRLSELGC